MSFINQKTTFFLVNICTPDFLAFVHNLRMKYIDSNKLSDTQ
ncbi:DDE transposase family protein, partial [Acinetobacter sp. MF4642]